MQISNSEKYALIHFSSFFTLVPSTVDVFYFYVMTFSCARHFLFVNCGVIGESVTSNIELSELSF